MASATNNSGEKNSLQFTTSEQFILDYMHKLGTSVFTRGEDPISFQAHSAKEYLSSSHGLTQPMSLWECCAALHLIHPSRLETVLKSEASMKPLLALMETLIASGRGDYVTQFVLALPPHDTSSSESVIPWLFNLWQQTKMQVKVLSEKKVVAHLVRKKSTMLPATENSEFGLNIAVGLELKRLWILLGDISRVLEALRQVKGDSINISNQQSQSVLSLSSVLQECLCTKDSIATLQALCVDPVFSFQPFLPAPACAPCSPMRKVWDQRRDSANNKAYLYYTPKPLRLLSTLRDVHIDNLCIALTAAGSSVTKARIHGLFDVLVTVQFNAASIDSLIVSLSQLLSLPSEVVSSINYQQQQQQQGGGGSATLQEQEVISARTVTLARQLVLYICLEATLNVLNIEGHNLDITLLARQVLKIAESVGYSLRLSIPEIFFILSLWKIDVNFDVSNAVNELGKSVHALNDLDPRYLQVIVQRLLAWGGEESSNSVRKLVSLFFHSNTLGGALLRTNFGITAVAASGLSEQLYMYMVCMYVCIHREN